MGEPGRGDAHRPGHRQDFRGPRRGPGGGLRAWLLVALVAAAILVAATPVLWWNSPWIARRLDDLSDGVLFRVETDRRVVALTLDDGPSSATPEILEVLERHGAKATFFVLAEEATRHADVTRRVVREGHELGNHLLRDRPTWRLSREETADALRRADSVLSAYGGARWVRPGGGWVDGDLLAAAEELGYRVALGSVYPFDARLPAPELLAAFVVRKVRSGSVIVLHEGPERGPRTVEVLRRALPALHDRGYRVVTLGRLVDSAAAGS